MSRTVERDAAIEAAVRDGKIPASTGAAWREAWRLDPVGTSRQLTASAEKGGLAADPARAAINAGALGVPGEPSLLPPKPSDLPSTWWASTGASTRTPAPPSPSSPDEGESTGWFNSRPGLFMGGATRGEGGSP